MRATSGDIDGAFRDLEVAIDKWSERLSGPITRESELTIGMPLYVKPSVQGSNWRRSLEKTMGPPSMVAGKSNADTWIVIPVSSDGRNHENASPDNGKFYRSGQDAVQARIDELQRDLESKTDELSAIKEKFEELKQPANACTTSDS